MCHGSLQGRRQKVLLALVFLLRSAALGHCQLPPLDLNSYCQFPLSVGVGCQSLTSPVTYPARSPYTFFDLGLSLRWPLPPMPVLQVTIRAGSMRFDSQSQCAR